MRGAVKWLGGLVVLLAASLIVVGARQRPDTRLPPGAAVTDGSPACAAGSRSAEIRKPLFLVCGEADTRNYEDAKRLAREVRGPGS